MKKKTLCTGLDNDFTFIKLYLLFLYHKNLRRYNLQAKKPNFSESGKTKNK